MTPFPRRPHTRRPRRGARLGAPLLAAGLLAAVLPLGVPAAASETTSETTSETASETGAGAGTDGAFSGYNMSGWAAPIRLEVYEPVLPIPAQPQLELMLGYSKVLADSTSGKGRASYLWPGDPLGEGLKTFLEQLGFPQAGVDALAGNGYPVQVNSGFPSGPTTQRQEPLPGAVMRTTAKEGSVVAKTGFSTDCDVEKSDADLLGGLLDGSLLPGLAGGLLGGAVPAPAGHEGDPSAEAAQEETCPIPAAIAALVDVDGYVALTRSSVTGGEASLVSKAALGEVKVLGGLLTLSGITADASALSDGARGRAEGAASFGTLEVLGQRFGIGPEGVEAAGERFQIPGLGTDPASALKRLGITVTLPKGTRTVKGDQATTTVSALQVEVDTAILSPLLKQLRGPLDELIKNIPFPEEAAIVKSLLSSVPDLAPRLVLTLGTATATVDTVQGLEPPVIDPPTEPTGPETEAGTEPGAGDGAVPPGAAGSGAGSDPAAPAPGGDVPAGGGGGGDAAPGGELPAAAPVAAGLPALFSIPGMLLLGGIALAGAAGSYLRKIGALALGGGAACTHGLDSGLPDLRKA
ncbi:choice-of-anchor P family protein [Nocardioides ochotonae]|uniref:choice-of-anchor P family protein n=1 Tax=Nocardioides ochotonae TaxID=2685869 RepID=UPI00140D8331|nr:choice-of-anchor P family protein [Nocardioides ochotonae]